VGGGDAGQRQQCGDEVAHPGSVAVTGPQAQVRATTTIVVRAG